MRVLIAVACFAGGLWLILGTALGWKMPFKRSPAPRWAPLVTVGFGILAIVLGILTLTGNIRL